MLSKSAMNGIDPLGPAAERVIDYVRTRIERGELKPGDQLPTERELARRLGISRPSVRSGIRSLSAMSVIESRHGRGTYVCDGPPTLDDQPLHMLARLHKLSGDQMVEARKALEVAAAGFAATRATREQVQTLSTIVDSMSDAEQDPESFLAHQAEFHRTLAKASGNPILTALLDMLPLHPQTPRVVGRNRDERLRKILGAHRRVYLALRARDPIRSRAAMESSVPLMEDARPGHRLGADATRRRRATKAGGSGLRRQLVTATKAARPSGAPRW